jgi:hypothetical protein
MRHRWRRMRELSRMWLKKMMRPHCAVYRKNADDYATSSMQMNNWLSTLTTYWLLKLMAVVAGVSG